MFLVFFLIIIAAKNQQKPNQEHFENVFVYEDEYYKNHLLISHIYWNANFNKKLKDVDPRYLYFKDGKTENYNKLEKIGKGAFSQVFLGKNIKNDQLVVLKELKPTKQLAINREIQILKAINGTTNTLQLLDAIRSQNKNQNATLVYQYLSSVNLLHLYNQLTLKQIKQYMYQLLQALNQTHSKGVMHRDIKLANTIIKNDTLYLIDWGLGEFYHPKKKLTTKVGTRYYKAPELLVGFQYYDYSIDMWSFGCNLASLLFKKQPIFKGKDNIDQLDQIVNILGTEDLLKYLEKYDIIYPDPPIHSKKPFDIFINQQNEHLVTQDALDLINKILVYDHKIRLTAQEAMQHSFFQNQ